MFDYISLKQIAERGWSVTEQIILQKFGSHDAATLFSLTNNNRKHLREWLGWVDNVREVQDSLHFINHINDNIEQNKSLTFAIFFDDELVGVIGFHEINWRQKQASIGYWLGEKWQGKGITTLSCQQLIDIGFKQLNLARITIACTTGNLKSQAVAEKLGFIRGETIHNKEWLYDQFVDHIVYFCDQ